MEFDPTNAIIGNRDLIRVAVARDPSQAIPLSGSFFGDAGDFLDMKVEVKVGAEPVGHAILAAARRPVAREREAARLRFSRRRLVHGTDLA